ncbi:hypothetical protein MMC06_000444 [Schaereria dolodes]|nr:hypothetical protein [Schaereria dolodes]
MLFNVLLTTLTTLTVVRSQSIGGSIVGPIVPGTTGKLGDAPITENNPTGVTYTAFLPNSNTTNIRGFVSGTASNNGTGVVFTVSLTGLPPADLGPFLYHIHDQPVPSDGNCTGTKAHLDPYIRGEIPPCDPTQPETCQVGDLSGKHGNITGNIFFTSYLDLYVSTTPTSNAFFGNRSVTIHSSNTTRLTCANFTLAAPPSPSASSSSPYSTSSNGTSSPLPTGSGFSGNPFTGNAVGHFVSGGAIVAGLMAFLL